LLTHNEKLAVAVQAIKPDHDIFWFALTDQAGTKVIWGFKSTPDLPAWPLVRFA